MSPPAARWPNTLGSGGPNAPWTPVNGAHLLIAGTSAEARGSATKIQPSNPRIATSWLLIAAPAHTARAAPYAHCSTTSNTAIGTPGPSGSASPFAANHTADHQRHDTAHQSVGGAE